MAALKASHEAELEALRKEIERLKAQNIADKETAERVLQQNLASLQQRFAAERAELQARLHSTLFEPDSILIRPLRPSCLMALAPLAAQSSPPMPGSRWPLRSFLMDWAAD